MGQTALGGQGPGAHNPASGLQQTSRGDGLGGGQRAGAGVLEGSWRGMTFTSAPLLDLVRAGTPMVPVDTQAGGQEAPAVQEHQRGHFLGVWGAQVPQNLPGGNLFATGPDKGDALLCSLVF